MRIIRPEDRIANRAATRPVISYTPRPPGREVKRPSGVRIGYFKLECGHFISWADAELNNAFRLLETTLGPMYYGCDKCYEKGLPMWHLKVDPPKVDLPDEPLF